MSSSHDFPVVDVLVGPQSLHELPGLLEQRIAKGGVVGAYADTTTRWSAELPRVRVDGPCAWVQIVAGCSNFCTYCIVPHVRGPEASRPAADILAEVAELAASGVREITLLGQNVNAYGKEPGFPGAESFADLLAGRLWRSGHRARPLHDVPPQGHVRGPHRRDRCAQPGL